MMELWQALQHSLLAAGAMLWAVLWALVLGFTRSAVARVFLTARQVRRSLGGEGLREVVLATVSGAASFSVSYAAPAAARTAFKKGGSPAAVLAFLFASTNLVVEFLVVLWLLLGWRVLLAEVLGGLLFVLVLWLLVRLTLRGGWADGARRHVEEGGENEADHQIEAEGGSLWEKVRNGRNRVRLADAFVMDWRLAWWELLLGFVIAGGLSVLVPRSVWQALFLTHSPAWVRLPENALVGALLASVSCVASLGNLPLAHVLSGAGLGLEGVLSFLYADLLALPLVLMYRQYFGSRAAGFIAGVLFVASVLTGLAVDALCLALHLSPRDAPSSGTLARVAAGWASPTLPNVIALIVAGGLVAVHLRYGGREKRER